MAMGIEFAPLSVPMERRLQTLCLIWFIYSFVLRVVVAVPLLIYLLFTRFYMVTLLYLAWYVFDHETPCRGGRRSKWLREKVGRQICRYFPVSLIKTADLPADRNYIFGCHPHGVVAFSYAAVFATDGTGFSEAYPGLQVSLITLRCWFLLPVHREVVILSGVCAASRESIDYILSNRPNSGQSVAIVIGGAREMVEAHPKTMNLVLKNRKGFVRMALRHGASLVPVISFGENDLYSTVQARKTRWYLKLQQLLIRIINIPLLIKNGRGIFQYSFGVLPPRKPLNVVIGKPIHVDQATGLHCEPSKDAIDQLHQRYISELIELYEQHRDKYGYSGVPIEII